MKYIHLLLALFLSLQLAAQPSVKALEDKELNVQDRFASMKSGSQTFQDYKVIKEYVLDGVWKIISDSIKAQDRRLQNAQIRIDSLKSDLAAAHQANELQKASMEEIIFDSTHIHVLGIPFTKSAFIILSLVVVIGLGLLIFTLWGRLKLIQGAIKEKTLIADTISNEFDEYKKKALEKQTKLSRELQNERNKLYDRGPKA